MKYISLGELSRRVNKPKNVAISLYIPNELHGELTAYLKEHKLKRVGFVRNAIIFYLKALKDKQGRDIADG